LALFGTAGAAVLFAPRCEELAEAATSFACLDSPSATEGPYWVDEMLNRSDIRVDPADGSVRPGVLLALSINVHQVTSAGCVPLAGAHVDIWHCDAAGTYSDEAANGSVGKKFLRGYQISDDSGAVQFTTIYPGWYSGRTVHIHVRVRTFSGSQVLDEFTSQFFFDDSLTDQVFTQSPYNTRLARDTRNANDMVLTGMTNGSTMFLNIAQTAVG
jgi:protocatechuate 3,4-dioxygenase beta subunit